MDDLKLTPEQERVAAELTAKLEAAYREEARRVARLFASKPDSQLLGKTEFELRDRLLHLGAVTVEALAARRSS